MDLDLLICLYVLIILIISWIFYDGITYQLKNLKELTVFGLMYIFISFPFLIIGLVMLYSAGIVGFIGAIVYDFLQRFNIKVFRGRK